MKMLYCRGVWMVIRFIPLHPLMLLFLFNGSMTLQAQTPALNAEKYRVYRERLLNEFMVSSPGNEPGTNIPASIRHAGRGQMRWGDATINLANYMAMLATEYRYLKDRSLPLEQTLEELHRAMMAMERLDGKAAAFYGLYDRDNIPDGFFIRDDVPASFTKDWAWKNPSFARFPHVVSDYSHPDIRVNEMSQDQVWNLIIGLALISRLVDDTTRLVLGAYGRETVSISERAVLAGYKIIRALQDSLCVRPFRFTDKRLCLEYWHVRNPYTGMSVKRGSGPTFLKYGFAEAGNFITDYAFGDLHWGNSPFGRVWFNLAAGVQYLQRLKREGSIENLYHIATTATIGQVWSSTTLVRLFNRHKKFPLVANHQYEHLALISCLLHGDCPPILQAERQWYEFLLNAAPWHGPFNFDQNSPHFAEYEAAYPYREEYHYEWSSVHRFVWPHRRGTGTREPQSGEFNGLDYLLLYNLFYLVYDPGWQD